MHTYTHTHTQACLKNPFNDTNPLQTARRIVEGDFTPIDDPQGAYSDVRCPVCMYICMYVCMYVCI